MKKGLRVCCAILTTTLLLAALSGCGEVDTGLLKKTVAAVDELAELKSGGFWRDSYLDHMATPAHSAEAWVRPIDGDLDWCMVTIAYGDGGALQMESGVARRDGMMYQRYSIDGTKATWEKSERKTPSTEMHLPRLELLTQAKSYEFFRKEKDGSIVFAYSQVGIEVFRAQLVAQMKDSMPTEFDVQQYGEEQRAQHEQQYAYITAMAEQTQITAFSGAITMDETGALLTHQMQFSMETPELEPDGAGGWTAAATKTADMRFVTGILARSDEAAEQKLVELFAELPASVD